MCDVKEEIVGKIEEPGRYRQQIVIDKHEGN
jgi:hypothetical protein